MSYLSKVERGLADPTFGAAERIGAALGLAVGLDLRPPVFLSERSRSDGLHAWCVGYVARRLRALGFQVAIEVPVADGRYRGWIDVLALDPVTGLLVAIEVKSWLGDIGGAIRQVDWYTGNASRAAAARGWKPTGVAVALVVLATGENDKLVREHDVLLRPAFPVRGGLPTRAGEQALALIDPARRRGRWLLRPTIDGRRTTPPYLDLADARRSSAA